MHPAARPVPHTTVHRTDLRTRWTRGPFVPWLPLAPPLPPPGALLFSTAALCSSWGPSLLAILTTFEFSA